MWKFSGCSGISFNASSNVFDETASRPSPSYSFTSIEVDKVVSLSEAVICNVPSTSSNRKQSRIGSEFFELITRLIACKWLNKAVLEIVNLMVFIC